MCGGYHTEARDKLRFDLIYVAHQSVWYDIMIVLRTFRVVFSPKSKSAPGSADEDRISEVDAGLESYRWAQPLIVTPMPVLMSLQIYFLAGVGDGFELS